MRYLYLAIISLYMNPVQTKDVRARNEYNNALHEVYRWGLLEKVSDEDTTDFFVKCDLKLRTVDGPLETKIKQTIDSRTNPVAKYKSSPNIKILWENLWEWTISGWMLVYLYFFW